MQDSQIGHTGLPPAPAEDGPRFVIASLHTPTGEGMTHLVVDEENGRCYEYPSEDAARAALPSFDVDPELNDPWRPHFSTEYTVL